MGRKRTFSHDQLQSEFDSWLAKEPGFTRNSMSRLEYRRMRARHRYYGLIKRPEHYHISRRGDATHSQYRAQCRVYDKMRYHRRKAARTVEANGRSPVPLEVKYVK
jgi:hypothetical protein